MAAKALVPFRRWHFDFLAGGAAEGFTAAVPPDLLFKLERERSYTGFVDGSAVFCFGAIEHWPGRYEAWAYVTEAAGPHMLWATREARRLLDAVAGRVEFTVRADFAPGHQWAKLLGFVVETPCKARYGLHGEDHVGYVRLR